MPVENIIYDILLIFRPLWDTSVTADVPIETPQGTVTHVSTFTEVCVNSMLPRPMTRIFFLWYFF